MEILIPILGVGIYFLIAWLRTKRRRKKEERRNNAFRQTYVQFAADHVDLYEKTSVPLDVKDIKAANKYYRIFKVLLFLFTPAAIAVLYLTLPPTLEDILLFLFWETVFITGLVLTRNQRNKFLLTNEKLIVKGVITGKSTKDGDRIMYFIEVSNKDSFQVSKSNYKQFDLGDIVTMEIVGTPDFWIKSSIGLVGKMEGGVRS